MDQKDDNNNENNQLATVKNDVATLNQNQPENISTTKCI